MTTPALTAARASVDYGRVPALTDLNLVVPAALSVAVIGPNGSGKSTFLRAVAGLLPIAEGSLDVPARSHRNGVAMVLQNTEVDPALALSAYDTVRIARFARLGLFRRKQRVDDEAIDAALGRLDIADLATRPIHEMSGGQRQRVFVAQGLAQESDLLLLDEPVTGLDVVSRNRILTVTNEEKDKGRTVILSTHSLEDARACDLVLVLATRQVAFGPPSEVLDESTLRRAFGGRVLHASDTTIVLDDPHHDHPHDPHRPDPF